MSSTHDFSERLRDLFALPGATFTCVVDPSAGTVIEAAGPDATDPAAVGATAATAARLVATAGSEPDDLDDLMVVSRRCYHLMRPVGGPGGEAMVVYVRLDRARSNLALARRALAAVAPGPETGPARPEPVSPRPPAAMPSAVPVPRPDPPVGDQDGGPAEAPGRPAPAGPAEAAPATAGSGGPSAPHSGAAVGGSGAAVPTAPEPGAASPVPLPRRPARPANRPRPRPPSVPDSSPSVLGQRWADDAGTLRRLLVGLRALGGQ